MVACHEAASSRQHSALFALSTCQEGTTIYFRATACTCAVAPIVGCCARSQTAAEWWDHLGSCTRT